MTTIFTTNGYYDKIKCLPPNFLHSPPPSYTLLYCEHNKFLAGETSKCRVVVKTWLKLLRRMKLCRVVYSTGHIPVSSMIDSTDTLHLTCPNWIHHFSYIWAWQSMFLVLIKSFTICWTDIVDHPLFLFSIYIWL